MIGSGVKTGSLVITGIGTTTSGTGITTSGTGATTSGIAHDDPGAFGKMN